MTIGLDAASRFVGLAVMADEDTLLEAVLISEKRRDSEDPLDRIDRLAEQVSAELVRLGLKYGAVAVVMEVTSGKQAGRCKGRMQGLQTLGAGIAVIRRVVKQLGLPLLTYRENVWTGGSPKQGRQLLIARMFPGYDASKDPGADVADAIGLLRYHFGKEREAQWLRQAGSVGPSAAELLKCASRTKPGRSSKPR